MIKALIFDLGNVVTSNNWHYDCPEKDREFCEYFGVTMDDFEKGWKIAWKPMQFGEVTEDEFWKLFLIGSGVKNVDIERAKHLWKKHQKLFSDVLNLIIKLRNYYPIIACTNNGKEWVDFYKTEYHLDAYFDAIINSAEVHTRKPEPEIYRIAIEKTGVSPSEILFIDDNDKPLEGAKKAGMQTLKFENAKKLEEDLKRLNIKTEVIDLSSRQHSFYWQSDRNISEVQIKRIFLSRHSFFDEKSARSAIEYGMNKKVINLLPPIKSGSINSVVRATLEDTSEVIMRMHPNGLKNGYFWVEKAVTDIAKKNGVPTFETYFIDDSLQRFPYAYMILSSERGNNMKLMGPFTPDVDKVLIEDTGRILALIHQIKTNKFGFFDNNLAKKGMLEGIHKSWKSHVFASFEDNLSYLVKMKVLSSDERAKIEQIFVNHDSIITCNSPRLVHNDVADWNQLTDGKKITSMLDWDEAFSGDPTCDFSTYSLFYDDTRLNNLIQGYETITKLPADFEAKFHLYRLRYIVSKLTLRTKRSVFEDTPFLRQFLKHSKELLIKELAYYSI